MTNATWRGWVYAGALITLALGLQGAGCRKAARDDAPAASSIRAWIAGDGVHLRTAAAEFVLNSSGYLKAWESKEDQSAASLDDPGTAPGQRVSVSGNTVADFAFDLVHAKITDASGKLGRAGKKVLVRGNSASTGLEETLEWEVYDDFPGMAVLSVTLRNASSRELALESVTPLQRRMLAPAGEADGRKLWMFSGASLKWGADEMFAIPAKYDAENQVGVPVAAPGDPGGAGGGIPLAAFWSRKVGEAIGHLEKEPLEIALPARSEDDGHVSAGVRIPVDRTLRPGQSYTSPRVFLQIFSGDFYAPLNEWSRAMGREGLAAPANNDENYAVSWCGWGYRSNVTPAQMTGTIPELKKLGIHWATLDDRWFDNYGDWQPRNDTFPADAIQRMVKDFHAQGIKVQIWWLPLGVEDAKSSFGEHKFVYSNVLKEHPDWVILDKDGKPARMTRDLVALCPAVPEVQAYHRQLVERFIRDWDFDGHKLDNIFAIPRCYNPKHHHKSPDESMYAMGEIYRIIFETTRALKPDSVTQSCPCGTTPSLAWYRYMDQGVTADPVNPEQVRRRIKMYKAILGPRAAVYGDHVELTRIVNMDTPKQEDLGQDFASTVGPGGVPGTKFIWPDEIPKTHRVYLSAAKEAHWKKWIGLYNQLMLSKGLFLNLYVHGFDDPEGYAIEKDGSMFYAFFAPQPAGNAPSKRPAGGQWKGEIELRGLGGQPYHVADYVNGKDYGTVQGPTAKIHAEFAENLLLRATPVAGSPADRQK